LCDNILVLQSFLTILQLMHRSLTFVGPPALIALIMHKAAQSYKLVN